MRPLLTGLTLALTAALTGCGTVGDAAGDALAVVDPTLAAANAYVDSVGTLVTALATQSEGASTREARLEAQRAAMAELAGPSKFSNPQLIGARENFQLLDQTQQGTVFQEHAQKFRNPALHGLKTVMNEGPPRDLPAEGSLKAAMGLQAAIELGLAPAIHHPVLGQLLPAFTDVVVSQ